MREGNNTVERNANKKKSWHSGKRGVCPVSANTLEVSNKKEGGGGREDSEEQQKRQSATVVLAFHVNNQNLASYTTIAIGFYRWEEN